MSSYKEKDIVIEVFDHWVLKVKTGFEIYKTGITHSTRCAQLGKGEDYKKRAILDCYKRSQVVIKYTDLIPLFGGGYSVGLEGDNSPSLKPALFDTPEEVQKEIDDINADYQEQIKAGERDEGDLYDGELSTVSYNSINGDLILLDQNFLPVEKIDWRSQL